MPLEIATYISDLNVANPTATDPKSQGDDHLRLAKQVLKTTFPNANAAITPTPSEFNRLADRVNWLTRDADTMVVGQLGWSFYGNGHTIFDSSSGVGPTGFPISNNVTPDNLWATNNPVLMGFNGTQTFGIKVDYCRAADSASNAIGTGQTWQTLTGSRTLGVTYTNSTGRTIAVGIQASVAVSNNATLSVSGVVQDYVVNQSGSTIVGMVQALVPAGATYQVTSPGGTLLLWTELR